VLHEPTSGKLDRRIWESSRKLPGMQREEDRYGHFGSANSWSPSSWSRRTTFGTARSRQVDVERGRCPDWHVPWPRARRASRPRVGGPIWCCKRSLRHRNAGAYGSRAKCRGTGLH